MALDRTWYNTLVDDDGSGMTGSVWDKADVDSLMDAIDAEIARIDNRYTSDFTARTSWSPGAFTEGGTPYPVNSSTAWYHKANDVVFYSFFVEFNLSIATGAVLMVIPPFPPISATTDETVVRCAGPITEAAYCRTRDAAWLEVRRLNNTAFPTGNTFLIGQGFYYWR